VSKTIGLNADERQKVLADVLAKRLGYNNVSAMIRDWLEKGFSEHISEDGVREILFELETVIKKMPVVYFWGRAVHPILAAFVFCIVLTVCGCLQVLSAIVPRSDAVPATLAIPETVVRLPAPIIVPTETNVPSSSPSPTRLAPTLAPRSTATRVVPTIAPRILPNPTATRTIPAARATATVGQSGVRIGAVCRDGTTSTATGSGACSRHGGVAYWLYR